MAELLSDHVRPLGLPVCFVPIATKLNLDPPQNLSRMVRIIVALIAGKLQPNSFQHADARPGRLAATVCFAFALFVLAATAR